jgi:hypothetical protein
MRLGGDRINGVCGAGVEDFRERERRVRTAPLMLRFNDGEEDGWDDKEWDDEEDVDVVDDCELWDCTDWFVIEEEDP